MGHMHLDVLANSLGMHHLGFSFILDFSWLLF